MRTSVFPLAGTIAALVTGLLVALAVPDHASERPAARPAPGTAPVTTAVRICPEVSAAPKVLVPWVFAAATSDNALGALVAGPVAGSGVDTATWALGADKRVGGTFGKSLGAFSVAASGAEASRLEALQFARAGSGPERSLSAARCVSPGRSFTFLGMGTVRGEDSTLVLVNPDTLPAKVDVSLAGVLGPIASSGAKGIRVPARGRVDLRLVSLVAGASELAVTVTATYGRVAAAVHDVVQNGRDPRGTDWVPGAAPASTDSVVAGFPAVASRKRVILYPPPGDDATVTLRVLGEQGGFVPSGFANLSAPAGQVTVVDVSHTLGTAAAAIEVRSDKPLQAGAVIDTRSRRVRAADRAFLAATAPINGSAVAPGVLVDRPAGRVGGVSITTGGGSRDTIRVVPLSAPGQSELPAVIFPARPDSTKVLDVTQTAAWTAALGKTVSGAPAVGLRVERLTGTAPVYVTWWWYEADVDQQGALLATVPLDTPVGVAPWPAVVPDPLAPVARPGERVTTD